MLRTFGSLTMQKAPEGLVLLSIQPWLEVWVLFFDPKDFHSHLKSIVTPIIAKNAAIN